MGIILLLAYVIFPIPLIVAVVVLKKENNRLEKRIKELETQTVQVQSAAEEAIPCENREEIQDETGEAIHKDIPSAGVPAAEQPEIQPEEVSAAEQPEIQPEEVSAAEQPEKTLIKTDEVIETSSVKSDKKIKKQSPAGLNATAVLFFVGVFLVSVGVAVFAASTWKYQGLAVRSLLLLSFSLIGFVSAWISGKKLGLVQTSVTTFSLGFVFIEGVLFLANGAGVFEGLLMPESRGKYLFLSAVFLIAIIYGISVRLIYRYSWCRWMSLAAYFFFLLFFVMFIDCGQTLFLFMLLLAASSIVLFIREPENNAVRIISQVIIAAVCIVGYAAAMKDILPFHGVSDTGSIDVSMSSLVLYLSAAGIAACTAFMSHRLTNLKAAMPFAFIAFAYTFKNIYIAAAGVCIMTAAGCLEVKRKWQHPDFFTETFQITGPVLMALFMGIGSDEAGWVYAAGSWCIFAVFVLHSVLGKKQVSIILAFLSLLVSILTSLYAAVGNISAWMGWLIVLLCAAGALICRRIIEKDQNKPYKILEITAMSIGMAVALICPGKGSIPLCLAAMAVLVYAVYPTKLHLFMILPLSRFTWHMKDLIMMVPLEFELKEYAARIIVFAVFLILSRLSDRGKGIAGINCFAPAALCPILYIGIFMREYAWTGSLVLLMLSMVAAAQITKENKKKNYVAIPLSAVLLMLAVWMQPFFEWPDYLYWKLLAVIPLLTVIICRGIFGKFKFFEECMCITLMIFIAAVYVEIVQAGEPATQPAGRDAAISIFNRLLAAALAVSSMLWSHRHKLMWYYSGFVCILILGLHNVSGNNGHIYAFAESCMALAASFIPDRDEKHHNLILFSCAALIFALLIPIRGGEMRWFVSLGMVTAIVFLLLRKRDRRFRSIIIGAGTLLCLVTVYIQPFFDWPEIIAKKLLFVMPTAVLFVLRMTRSNSGHRDPLPDMFFDGRLLGWSFILIMAAFFFEAVATGSLTDAIITAVCSLIIMLYGAWKHNRLLLYAGAAGVIIVVIYMTRGFWTSLPWWVYLIAAGTAAIAIAVITEIKKGKRKTKDN